MNNVMLVAIGYETDISKFAYYFSRFGTSYFNWYNHAKFGTQESVLVHEMEHVRQFQSVAGEALRDTADDYKQWEKCFSSYKEAEIYNNAVKAIDVSLSQFRTAQLKRYPGSGDLKGGEAEAVAAELEYLVNQSKLSNNK